MKYCQGPECHTYTTQDRLKGTKPNKTYQTRRRSNLNYFDEFCDRRCFEDWFRKYGTQAVDHFGRLNEAKHLTEENAWTKDYDYNYRDDNPRSNYRFVNKITKERRALTQEQFNDSNYTINTGE
jgi:hypothetical protein|tara:strand:+ start:390 stop:761 length:372 start_codon:yes stop_codon:yes gene_type:complete